MRQRRIGATVRWTSGPECSTPIVARNPVRRSLSEGEVEMRDRPKAVPACTHSGILCHDPSSTASSSPANRSGSAMASMATIFPCRIVKSSAIIRRPRGATTMPTAPLTSTGRAARARPRIDQRRHRLGAADLLRPASRDGHRVRTKDDIRVEDRQQTLKVATSRGGQEGVDHSSLPVEIGVTRLRDSSPRFASARLPSLSRPPTPCTRRRARPASCRVAAGERPTIGAILVEGDAQHVVQDERQPYGWLQHLQNDEQRQADRVGQQRSCSGSTACPTTPPMR